MLKLVDRVSSKLAITYDDSNSEVDLGGLYFNIDTYGKYSKDKDIFRNGCGKVVIDFCNTLDQKEKDEILRMVKDVYENLRYVSTPVNLRTAIKTIATLVNNTFVKINLKDKLLKFVNDSGKIDIIIDPNVGNRPQDTPDKTFGTEYYPDAYAICIFTKLVFPFCGHVVKLIGTRTQRREVDQDIYPFVIMEKYLRKNFTEFYEKMAKFHAIHITDAKMGAFVAFKGLTTEGQTERKHANTYVKTLTNFDPYILGKNPFSRIHGNITKGVDTSPCIDTKASKLHYKETRLTGSTDELGGNQSDLENSLAVITEPTIIRPLMRSAMNTFIEEWLETNEIDREKFERIVKFYMNNPFAPTDVNEVLVGMFIGPELGSAWSIRFANAEIFMTLVTCLQMYLDSYGFRNIVPLVSAELTNIEKQDRNLAKHLTLNGHAKVEKNSVFEKLRHLTDFLAGIDSYKKYFAQTGFFDNIEGALIGSELKTIFPEGIGDYSDKISDLDHVIFDNNVLNEFYGAIYKLMVEKGRSLKHIKVRDDEREADNRQESRVRWMSV